MWAFIKENFKFAWINVKGQPLRTSLTVMIISFGILALVGILTAVASMESSISESFALMGSNTFSIENRGMTIRINNKGIRPKNNPIIKYDEAKAFTEKFTKGQSSINFIATGAALIKYEEKKTNPNVAVWAGDEGYIATAGFEIDKGRPISKQDVENNAKVAVIGKDVSKTLFGELNPINKFISIKGQKFRVIGLTKEKGSGMNFGGDRSVFIPVSTGRATFARANISYKINVMVSNKALLDPTIGEATALMRGIRKLKPKQDNNFNISKSDNLSAMLIGLTSQFTMAAVLIGFITLFGASIALMNIMLVSVTERTKEIGVRKAIGANRKTILYQFLFEAIMFPTPIPKIIPKNPPI